MAAPLQPTILGLGVSAAQAAGVAGLCRWSEGSAASPLSGGSRAVLLVSDIEVLAGGDYWRAPYFAWIETLGADERRLAALADRAGRRDFYYSFGASSSTTFPLAGVVAAHVGRLRPGLSEEHLQDIELALHEAISNALVHGNLGVGSMRSLSIEALDEYSRSMSRSLSDPVLANRRVEVAGSIDGGLVDIDVTDEGDGYEAPPVKTQSACGRGLDLIAAVAEKCEVADGGRKLSMRFRL
jgi:hypothetical protein